MKLDEKKVKIIQQLLELDDIKDQQIGDLFGVSRELINHIRHGHRWSSVTGINPPREEKVVVEYSNSFRDYTTKEDVLKERLKEALTHFITTL